MSFAEDLSPFLADFGVPAVVGGVTVVGIFDNYYAELMGITAGSSPTLIAKAADCSDAAVGNAVTVGTVGFTVASVEPDGSGLVVLRLK
jgi:hypothetical protein